MFFLIDTLTSTLHPSFLYASQSDRELYLYKSRDIVIIHEWSSLLVKLTFRFVFSSWMKGLDTTIEKVVIAACATFACLIVSAR